MGYQAGQKPAFMLHSILLNQEESTLPFDFYFIMCICLCLFECVYVCVYTFTLAKKNKSLDFLIHKNIHLYK